ncbi:MAG: response regulator [Patescibacteria group bacterium]|jgi:DNA-binding response OmpR family regulator
MAKTKKMIMMIVEDDEVLLRALYLVLHEDDYTVTTASDGDTGLKMAERIKPDIILLDLLLPKMNGFDFLRYIKADPALKNIPVVVLSNLGDQESISKAKGLGALDYFVKSGTDLADLRVKIADILKV